MSKAAFVFAALMVFPAFAHSATSPRTSKAIVAPLPAVSAQDFVRSYVKAMNRGDVPAMMKMFSKGAAVTSIGDGTISHGWGAIQTDAQQFMGRRGTFKFTLESIDVTPLGNGYSLVIAPFRAETVGQDEDIELPAAMTLVLERFGSTWKVVHEHWSSKVADDTADPDDPDGLDGGKDDPDDLGPGNQGRIDPTISQR
jgi:ketosteroid isomerase-like protein